jgi:hypothetical protein
VADGQPYLYWKYEDGPPDGAQHGPGDIGPLWLEQAGGGGETLNDGQWVTRAEARRIAVERGLRLEEDE